MPPISPAPLSITPHLDFNPTVAEQLFNARRVWKREDYDVMVTQSAVPLHLYRSERPDLKDLTPLGFILMRAVMAPTPTRLRRLPYALRVLASPALNTGPAHMTELGALMAAHAASIYDTNEGMQIMHTWRQAVAQHLLAKGVDWEDAWRQGDVANRYARHHSVDMHSSWRKTDALSRWERILKGERPFVSSSGLQDPSSEGCARLMQEGWDQAKDWRDFPANHLFGLARTMSDLPAFQATLLDRLRTWGEPQPAPMFTPAHVDQSLLATFDYLEQQNGSLTAAELDTLVAQSGQSAKMAAWVRQRQAAEVPTQVSSRRRFRS
jgi:hypothetical protein